LFLYCQDFRQISCKRKGIREAGIYYQYFHRIVFISTCG